MCRHMGGFWSPKFSKQGPLFGRFSINMGGLSRNWPKMGHFPPKFIIKVGMTASSAIRRGYPSENRGQTPVHPQVV